jgi:hypothetical protein
LLAQSGCHKTLKSLNSFPVSLLEGTRYIWAPASSFLVGAPQPEMPGEKRLGAVVYELDNATLTARIAEVPGLTQHWFPANVSG